MLSKSSGVVSNNEFGLAAKAQRVHIFAKAPAAGKCILAYQLLVEFCTAVGPYFFISKTSSKHSCRADANATEVNCVNSTTSSQDMEHSRNRKPALVAFVSNTLLLNDVCLGTFTMRVAL